MTTWQEPSPGTKRARIVRLLRRPEGVNLQEAAKSANVRTYNARAYISQMRSEGLEVLDREEPGRGRVWYVPKVDRRRKEHRQAPEGHGHSYRNVPTAEGKVLLTALSLPWSTEGLATFGIAALDAVAANPDIGRIINHYLIHPRG